LQIKAQTHNVNGAARERDRYFGAMQIPHAQRLGGSAGSGLPANFVVVGE
jgi:hypothetical protein